MGASTPGLNLGMCHPAYLVPEGNAVAGILLPGRSSEAGRQRLALLHPIPLRPGIREVGDGEGSGASHHRLIARLLGALTSPGSCVLWSNSSMSARPRHPVRSAKVILSVTVLFQVRNHNAPPRPAAQFGAGQATAAAGDGAGRGTQAGGETQENSSRLTCGLRRLHAGNGGLYAARWVYGA